MHGTNNEVFYEVTMLNGFPEMDAGGPLDPPLDGGNFYQKSMLAQKGIKTTTKTEDKCVGLYVEVEYDIVEYHGGEDAAREWVEAAFAQVFILYANDGM